LNPLKLGLGSPIYQFTNLSTSQFAPAGSPDPAVWRRIWQSAASACDLL